MQSDKFLFVDPEKALDKIERIASCYEFSTKDVLKIRLLTEEIISVIMPTLKLAKGGFRVVTSSTSFAITIDCAADMGALDSSTKEALLKMGRSEKKGIRAMLGKVFEFLTMPDVDYASVPSPHIICSYNPEMGYHSYHWDSAFIDTISIPEPSLPRETAKKTNDHDLEISIIEAFADDIQVGLNKSKAGLRLQITVVKNFTNGQLDDIEI